MMGSSGPETATVQLSIPMPRSAETRCSIVESRESSLPSVVASVVSVTHSARAGKRTGCGAIGPNEENAGAGCCRLQRQVDRLTAVEPDPRTLNRRRDRLLNASQQGPSPPTRGTRKCDPPHERPAYEQPACQLLGLGLRFGRNREVLDSPCDLAHIAIISAAGTPPHAPARGRGSVTFPLRRDCAITQSAGQPSGQPLRAAGCVRAPRGAPWRSGSARPGPSGGSAG